MKLFRSSRLRIAVISVFISGLVLLVFGSVTWWKLSRDRLATLDASLARMGQRVAAQSDRMMRRGMVKMMVDSALGTDRAVDHFFMATDKDGQVLQDYHWPHKADLTELPVSENEINSPEGPMWRRPPPPRPGEERGRRGDSREWRSRKQFEPRFYTLAHEGRRLRVGVFGNQYLTFRFGADLGQYAEDIRQIKNAFLLSLPGALLVIALGSLYVANKAFHPVDTLSDSIENLSIQGVHERLDSESVDTEYRRMTQAYNMMLERLERSFSQATRFSADASHELKTPLAVMRGNLEQALSRCPTDSDEQRTYTSLLEETDRQQNILESLLLLSRADGGKLALSLEELDLSDWLGSMVEDAGLLAEERGITVLSEIVPGVHVNADPILLQRAVHNLLNNAVKYNEDNGVIACALKTEAERVILIISNTGEPIQGENRERLFDRFVRGAANQSGEVRPEGLGLGLSLVREIVHAHQGTVSIETNEEGQTQLVVELPRLDNQG